jgi:predicted ribosomally synthesized peptide with SipW-like signal peptide
MIGPKKGSDNMKKMMPLIASIALIMVASLVAGAGTMAWITDTETAQVTATAATKDLQIALGNDGGPTGSWHSGSTLMINGPVAWDDEDTFTFVIWFKNAGNGGAKFLYREYGGYSDDVDGSNPFKDCVQLVSMYEYYNGAWDATNWVNGSTDDTITDWGWCKSNNDDGSGNEDAYLMLSELLNMKTDKYDEKCYHYASSAVQDYLPSGGSGLAAAKYTFKLRGSETTNDIQGKTFSFTITCLMTDEDIHTYLGPVP